MDLNRIFMKNACPTKVGGQAILEGLMMRGSRSLAIAIRQPDGDIHLTVEPLKKPGAWKKIPIIRGVGSFISSLVTGTSVLMYGADVLEKLEEKAEPAGAENSAGSTEGAKAVADAKAENKTGSQKSEGIPKGAVITSVLLALVLVVALFILLPTFILGLIRKAGLSSVILLNLIEGIIRICIFIAYIMFVRKMPDIRRTFEYHGAEHKTIHCYENGLELTPQTAQSFYTLHPRCGTSFLMFVMVIALLVFSLLGWPNLAVRVVSRLLLIPVIAGLSYELLQFTGRHDGKCVRALSMPGILLQKLTTKEPTDDMLEVAILAVKAVLPSHEDPSVPVEYWVGRVTPAGEYIKDEEATEKYRADREK